MSFSLPVESLSLEESLQIEDLVTEDDTPVDNIFSEKQQRLLTESLYASWHLERPFIALANVGLFYAIKKPPLVPDVLVSLEVTLPKDIWVKHHRSYFLWEYGKPPEVVIEIVSNQKGQELEHKLKEYALIGIPYYVVLDPQQQLGPQLLHCYQLNHLDYLEMTETWLPKVGLGLQLWEGCYEDRTETWLRWIDASGNLILTGAEQAQQIQQRATQAEQQAAQAEQQAAQAKQQAVQAEQQAAQAKQQAVQAEQQAAQAKQQAAQAEQRAEQLADYLRTLGIDPNNLNP
jgi:Uma2 family endonuclease